MDTLITITDEDIAKAEADLDQARQDLFEAQEMARLGQVPTIDTGIVWAAANGRHQQAATRLARLHSQREEQRQAMAARDEAEKTHAKACKQRAAELRSSRERVTAALKAAQDAMSDALDAVEDHNALVQQHAGEMATQGLSPLLDDRPGADPRQRLVYLDGEWWRTYKGQQVLEVWAGRMRLAHFQPTNYLIEVERFRWGRLDDEAGLVALVEHPEPREVEDWRLVVRMGDTVTPPPVHFRSESARRQAEDDAKRNAPRWVPGGDPIAPITQQ